MVLVKTDDESVVDMILMSYYFMRMSVCLGYQGGGKRTTGKEEERLQSPGWFWGPNEWGSLDVLFLHFISQWISNRPRSNVWIICALSLFSQRWKKELEKNREKVLGGGEKKEKEKEKKEVRVGAVIRDLLYKTQVQSDLIPISVDFILHQKWEAKQDLWWQKLTWKCSYNWRASHF